MMTAVKYFRCFDKKKNFYDRLEKVQQSLVLQLAILKIFFYIILQGSCTVIKKLVEVSPEKQKLKRNHNKGKFFMLSLPINISHV